MGQSFRVLKHFIFLAMLDTPLAISRALYCFENCQVGNAMLVLL